MLKSQPEHKNNFEEPPIQDFTTAGLVMDLADRKVSLTLCDGTVIHGVLRSYDEFGTFVIQDAIETIYHKKKYAKRNRGVWIIRGQTVALLGSLSIEKEEAFTKTLGDSWTETDFDTLEQERDSDRKKLEEQREKEAQEGRKHGLYGSTFTNNPYRFYFSMA